MSRGGSLTRQLRAARARPLLSFLIGGLLALPATAQTLRGDGSIVCGAPYAITSGDTLSRISARAYGDPMLYGFIADANWDALGGDPENIAVGMALMIPCVDASGEVLSTEQAEERAASLEAAVAAEGPLTAAELDTLFGPVALFPDPLLTPVLVAVTFPLDVVKAGRFVESTEALPDTERAAGAADANWDESLRELAAAFPDLVTRMSDNIDWTEQAGEAVVAQTDEVLAAIQRLRATAQENGYLVDNTAQTVTEVNDRILIAPTDPNVVYVPTYDSKVVYSTPLVGPPVYHYGYDYGPGYVYHDDNNWSDALITGAIILGGAIILDEIFDDSDWNGWDSNDNIDWDRGDITIDRGDINIDRDEINIGDGDRPRIGDGDRVSIGDSDRPQIDRAAIAAARPGDRGSIASPASRDVARQKIEKRQSTGAAPASLRPSTFDPARQSVTEGRGLTNARSDRGQASNISRPRTSASPKATHKPSRSSAFQKPSRASRPAASASRGRASSAGRSGGGRGGGGRR